MSTIEKALDKLAQQQPAAPVAQTPAVEADLDAPAVAQTVESTSIEAAQTLTVAAVPAADSLNSNVNTNASTETAESALIELDLAKLSAKNFVTLGTERRLIYEEYRTIKRKLINNAFGPLASTLKHPNLIMVTSTRPAEGKTFTAVNLALSIALEQDKTVLLVDADVLRPNVMRTLEIQIPIGLTDYLSTDKYQVSDILFSTNIERLKLIGAGRPHLLSTELLASDKMLELASEFATRYPDRIVIFDAPPILGVTETAVLASVCGQAVMVCEEKRTKLNELEKALSLLPPDIAAGFVINKAQYSRDSGYGYGYGYYAKED